MIPDLLMAPLAEITTPVLRSIIRRFSDRVHLFSEMLSAASIARGGFQDDFRSALLPSDPPFSFQLLGNSPETMVQAMLALEKKHGHPLSFDINMGCSAPEILSRNQGAALLNDAETASRIIQSCRSVCTELLSVKIRAGFDSIDIDRTIDFVSMAAASGADFITIHPRSAKQAFSRKADWKVIQAAAERVSIPIIGNGDIEDAAHGLRLWKENNCYGIMAGRSATAKPWIFTLMQNDISRKHDKLAVNLEEISELFATTLIHMAPNIFHKSRAHRFYGYFCTNFMFGHRLFAIIRNESDPERMHNHILAYLKRNPGEKTIHCSYPEG